MLKHVHIDKDQGWLKEVSRFYTVDLNRQAK